MSICELRSVTKTYGSGPTQVHAIRNVDLSIEAGELIAIVGPSGSGKTTLLNQVGCLDNPTSGEVLIEGSSTATLSDGALAHLRAERIGFIFQSFNLIPVLTALENVELSVQLAGGGGGRQEALALLAEVGLEGLGKRRPNQLSGGQQQRVAIARALVKRPGLVIADEPTANLDSTNGKAVVNLMRILNQKRGTTFLFSTHDPMVVAHARRVVTLRDGQVASDQTRGA